MDPQEIIDLLLVQDSSGNENPLLNRPQRGVLPELPPDYQIERRPYTGAEVPMGEFAKREQERMAEQARREAQADIERRAAEREREGAMYKGIDVPTPGDVEMFLDKDLNLSKEGYAQRFGLESLERALEEGTRIYGRRFPNYGAPMPRPRRPDFDPVTEEYLDLPIAELTKPNIQKRLSDVAEADSMLGSVQETYKSLKPFAAPGHDISRQEYIDLILQQPDIWEGSRGGGPTDDDLEVLRFRNPDLEPAERRRVIEDFARHFGPSKVPDDIRHELRRLQSTFKRRQR